jgi:RimJ/RimL family protein N-acetyltransferase
MEAGGSMKLKFARIQVDDVPALAEWLSSSVWPFHVYSATGARHRTETLVRQIEDEEEFRWFWILAEGGEKAGAVKLTDLSDLTPMFDLRVAGGHRNRGVGTQALRWLTKTVFEIGPDKRRVEGQTRRDNAAMRRVFLKCRYVKEAHYRKCWPGEGGAWHDGIGYGILRDDWETGETTPVEWEA